MLRCWNSVCPHVTPGTTCEWAACITQFALWLKFCSDTADSDFVESLHATLELLKRRVPVSESVVGRDPFPFGAAAPKLCNVDSAQAAADVGENRSSPVVLCAVRFGLGTGEQEDDFFPSRPTPDIFNPGQLSLGTKQLE